MKQRQVWRGLLAIALCISGPMVFADNVRIIQTNSQDDVIHLIDPATHSVVDIIEGIPVNHGAAAAPDGSRLYFSSEAKFTLDVVDSSSLEIIDEIDLSGRPNNISISNDGRYVYVGIMEAPGGIDVIDTQAMENIQTLQTEAPVHNVYVTPDGKYLVAGTFGMEENLQVFNTDSLEREFVLYPPEGNAQPDGIRPVAFSTRDDGSTDRMFVQISGLHGFAVVDFSGREELMRIEMPEIPEEERDPPPYTGAPAHGIGVAPDQQTLWVCSRMNGFVYAYSLPGLDFLGGVDVGSHPDWLTFSPDSRFVYVANGHSDDVSVVDINAMEELMRVPVGKAPKRNITAILP